MIYLIKRIKREELMKELKNIKKVANYDVKINYNGDKKNIKIHNSEIEDIDIENLHSIEYFYIKDNGKMNLAYVIIEN